MLTIVAEYLPFAVILLFVASRRGKGWRDFAAEIPEKPKAAVETAEKRAQASLHCSLKGKHSETMSNIKNRTKFDSFPVKSIN